MEFLDDEARPKLLFQSRSAPTTSSPPPPTNLLSFSLIVSVSLSAVFFAISIISVQSELLRSLLLWIALSLLLGPFAPSSFTGGDTRVGAGKLIPDPVPPSETLIEKTQFLNRRSKHRKFDESGQNPVTKSDELPEKATDSGNSVKKRENQIRVPKEEREWTNGDLEMLKKLLTKYPVGMPKRWEAISEAFGGAHGVDSVIKTAKSLGGKKTDDSDSFARFLKDRKPLDQRVEEEAEEANKEAGWTGGDDVALLNALKVFPKETAMRWEKIAAAVPGKTKAACVKRVSELKKDFRSSKDSNA